MLIATVLNASMSVMILFQMAIHQELEIGIGFIVLILIFIIQSFNGYVGLRGIGKIDSHLWRVQIFVFLIQFIISTALILIIGFIFWLFNEDPDAFRLQIGTEQTRNLLANLIEIGIWEIGSTACFVGLFLLLILRKQRLKTFDISLAEILSSLKKRGGPRAKGFERKNTLAGIGLISLGVWVFFDKSNIIENSIRGMVAWFLFIQARRYFQPEVYSLLTVDLRKVILLLRPFDDDRVAASKYPGFKDLIDYSLETRLMSHFSRYGPFITIGSTRDSLPYPGAARAFLSEDEWRLKVRTWIADSSLIIMYVGRTFWTNWELVQIIEMERIPNLILMFPEINKRLGYEEIHHRVENLKWVFSTTRWSEAMSSLKDYYYLRAILFCEDGSIIVIKSRYINRDSYHLAALIAHYLIINKV